jgi:hypothetical protein
MQTSLEVNAKGEVLCPDCGELIRVGTAGIENFNKQHRGRKACDENKRKKQAKDSSQKNQKTSFDLFPKKKIPIPVPPIVSTPLPIQPAPIAPGPATTSTNPGINETHQAEQVQSPHNNPRNALPICPLGVNLLDDFRNRIDLFSAEVREADDDHELAQFSGNASALVVGDEDVWETWDKILNRLLERSKEELKLLVCRGEKGLKGLYRIFECLVFEHGVGGALIEGKLHRLCEAMEDV